MPSVSHPEAADPVPVPPADPVPVPPGDPVPVPPGERPAPGAGRRVVLIDPRLDRRGIMGLFVEQCPGLSTVGLAADLGEAETQIREQQADLAIVEIQMPVTEGLATIAALHQQFPELRIAVCSFHDDKATREAAQANGADAYLTKPFAPRDLLTLAFGPPRSLVESATP